MKVQTKEKHETKVSVPESKTTKLHSNSKDKKPVDEPYQEENKHLKSKDKKLKSKSKNNSKLVDSKRKP
jgi:hypothetical protein